MRFLPLILFVLFLIPIGVNAQDSDTFSKARVVEVVSEHSEILPQTETTHTIQTIRVEVLEGIDKGKEYTFENDYLLLNEGDLFYLRHLVNTIDGTDQLSVADPYRIPVL